MILICAFGKCTLETLLLAGVKIFSIPFFIHSIKSTKIITSFDVGDPYDVIFGYKKRVFRHLRIYYCTVLSNMAQYGHHD